MKVMIKRIK